MKPEELKKRLAEHEDMVLLDVREQEEVKANDNMIEGAQNMPMGKVFLEAAQGHLPKDKKIITICKAGGRCQIVAKELREKGYDIEHLEGGLKAWNAEANT